MGDINIHPSTRLLLAKDYERMGQLNKAYIEVVKAINSSPENLPVLNMAISFFERFRNKGEKILVMNGLSLLEINHFLDKFLQMKSREGGSHE
jgi:hypothetical protein